MRNHLFIEKYGLYIFALVCLTLPILFITLHLRTPSDGARLSDGNTMFTYQGALVTPYSPGSTQLLNGDVVVEVSGRSIEDWAEDLFRIGASRPTWEFNQTVTYGVLRDGENLSVQVTLGRLPLGLILARHWGAILFALVSQVVALFVLLRRPGDPAARALFIWAVSGSHTYAWSFFLQVSDIVGGVGFWLYRLCTPGLWLIYWAAALHVALVFPKPLPIVRRYPRLVPALYVLSYLIFLVYLLFSWPISANMLDWLNKWAPAETLVAGVYLFATVLLIIWQYRTSRTYSERAKIRWAVFGGVIAGSLGLVLWIVTPALLGVSPLNANLLGLLMLLFPLSIAIAIWRHQLFDIDLIIRRTLVYGSLSILLVILYFSAVILFQNIFTAISGQQSTIAVVISTLLIAASFNPLRMRVQSFIDRRFYRGKYDAEQTLTAFAQSARNETDLQALTDELLRVVSDTMQPEQVSIWLKSPVDIQGEPFRLVRQVRATDASRNIRGSSNEHPMEANNEPV